jgi:hypothetical protein
VTNLSNCIDLYRDDEHVTDEQFAAFVREAIELDGYSEQWAKMVAPLVAQKLRGYSVKV